MNEILNNVNDNNGRSSVDYSHMNFDNQKNLSKYVKKSKSQYSINKIPSELQGDDQRNFIRDNYRFSFSKSEKKKKSDQIPVLQISTSPYHQLCSPALEFHSANRKNKKNKYHFKGSFPHTRNSKKCRSSNIDYLDLITSPSLASRNITSGNRSSTRTQTRSKNGKVSRIISAFEENTRSTSKKRAKHKNKNRLIGVPLIGMHNTCGLPVITQWSDEHLNSLQMSSDFVKRLGSNVLVDGINKTIIKHHSKHSFKDPPQKSLILMKLMNENSSKRINKNLNYKKCINYSSKSSNGQFPLNAKQHSQSSKSLEGDKVCSDNSKFYPDLVRHEKSVKRATLYAKNDSSEAINALTSLCLNPMARSENASNMIW